MLQHLEREYLLRIARRCHRKGLNNRDALRATMAEAGPMAQPGAARCAVSHVFED